MLPHRKHWQSVTSPLAPWTESVVGVAPVLGEGRSFWVELVRDTEKDYAIYPVGLQYMTILCPNPQCHSEKEEVQREAHPNEA